MTRLAAHMAAIRAQFPGLARQVNGRNAAFFDGPGGTQTPERVIEAVSRCLAHTNANHGGLFATSREGDALLDRAHAAAADFLGAAEADEIVFGANMTTLTLALSRALGRTWRPGDEIIVTRLDHDANVSPWVLAARDAGATVKWVSFQPDDLTLNLVELRSQLSSRTRLVAVGCASNATGGINPVREICQWAHAAGSLVFLDAVHYAPHALVNVAEWGCDFLACSAYKFFGPHVGILWGRRRLLEELEAYKVRPAPNTLPGKWMTGTQNHEGIVGTLAAMEYLTEIGRNCGGGSPALSRRENLTTAFAAIGEYERSLAAQFLTGIAEIPEVRVWGITDAGRLHERLPTFSLTHERVSPMALASQLAERGLFAWHGNYYALNLSEELGLEPEGMVRVGFVHYNTSDEIDRLLAALRAAR